MVAVATWPRHRLPPPGVSRAPRQPLRILVFHRKDLVRAGVLALLADGTDCVATGEGLIHEAIRAASARPPALVLFEHRSSDGPEVCRLLSSVWPRPALVAMTELVDTLAPHEVLEAGADGVVAVDAVSGDVFLSVVLRTLAGERGLAAGYPTSIRGADRTTAVTVGGPEPHLTRRERQILQLIGEGLSNREIAEVLVLSVKTVEAHRANLGRKLGLRNRAGLMRLALARAVA